jgi:hypothetical protein
VARAKHTDRAEARRRYRQASRLTDDASPSPDEPGAPGSGRGPAVKAQPQGGLTWAFRAAYHPANVREDIALLPQLLRSRAFLASAGLVVVATVLVAFQPTGPLAAFAFQTFVLPPAVAPIFVAGFFAPRASYLLGLIVSLLDLVAYAFLVSLVAPTLGTEAPNLGTLLGTAFLFGPPAGILFAAAAAWYRRFLALSSRRRQQPASGRSRAKAAARR